MTSKEDVGQSSEMLPVLVVTTVWRCQRCNTTATADSRYSAITDLPTNRKFQLSPPKGWSVRLVNRLFTKSGDVIAVCNVCDVEARP